jgi:hypothetical protein
MKAATGTLWACRGELPKTARDRFKEQMRSVAQSLPAKTPAFYP